MLGRSVFIHLVSPDTLLPDEENLQVIALETSFFVMHLLNIKNHVLQIYKMHLFKKCYSIHKTHLNSHQVYVLIFIVV